MKRAWTVSFGAAACCHAMALFGLQTGPSLLSADSGGESLGVELVGEGGSEAGVARSESAESEKSADETHFEEPAPAVPSTSKAEPAPEKELPPEPDTEAMVEDPVPEDPEPAPSPANHSPANPIPRKTKARNRGGVAANVESAASGTGPAGGARGGGGASGKGWDTSARPAYQHNPPPVYPPAALHARRQGTVIVCVEVSASGAPLEVKLSRGSGFEELDASALQAVRRWRFEPARLAGVPVASRVVVPVAFSLFRRN